MSQQRLARKSFVPCVVGLCAALVLSSVAWAAAVARPNPAPGTSAALTSGTRTFSWTDIDLADGGNQAGVHYKVYLGERSISTANPAAINTSTELLDSGRTKSVNTLETFTIDPTAASGTYAVTSPRTLKPNRLYIWRVDVDDVPGQEWRVIFPMNQPGVDSRSPFSPVSRVSAFVRFQWDSVSWNPGAVMEKMLLIDTNVNVEQNWVLPAPATGLPLNTGAVVKTYDTRALSSSRDSLREYWIPDGMTRLIPGHTYKWRVVFCDKDGGPLYHETNGTAGRQGGEESYWWADQGSDFDPGWYFTVVPRLGFKGTANTESVIIYHENQYGTLPRDPEENYYQFRDEALALQAVHQNSVNGIETIIHGSEELAASYGDTTLTTPEAPWLNPITMFDGWDSIGTRAGRVAAGFSNNPSSTAEAVRYKEHDKVKYWEANGIRDWLYDMAGGSISNGAPHIDLPNLKHVIILGDNQRVAPSFYYHYIISSTNLWLPTDFFYSTQGTSAEASTTPRYQVSRIPMRQTAYRTVDQNGAVWPPQTLPADTTNPGPNTIFTNTAPEQAFLAKINNYAILLNDQDKRTAAFRSWFGRATLTAGSTLYYRWYQFFNSFAQYLLSQQVSVGNGQMGDIFSGMKVRHFDLFSLGTEALTKANALLNIRNPQPTDVPGFVYLLCYGTSSGFNGNTDGNEAELKPGVTLSAADFTRTFSDLTDGRRPLLVSPASCLARPDNSIWSLTAESLGESAVLAQGGPVGMVGFASGVYTNDRASYTRSGINYTLANDEPEGHTLVAIDRGVLKHEASGDADAATLGKIEFVKKFARAYGDTQNSGSARLGALFNRAVQDYINTHSAELTAADQRTVTTTLGASLLGDCALIVPQIQKNAKDFTRPTLTDANPRVDTDEGGGFSRTARYNSQNMPVHVIPHTSPYDATQGTSVTLNIQTDAPNVRVRVLTPFLQNLSYVSGHWFDTTEVTENATEVHPTANGSFSYTFTARTPSIYLVVVQAQNPAWVQGTDPVEWRWLHERWMYVHVVNEFVRDASCNVLVVDSDQHDRYYLNGDVFDSHVEDYYVNPARGDGDGYLVGTEDPRNFSNKAIFPLLNKEAGQDLGLTSKYKYQYWCCNVYENLYSPNAANLKSQQRYYGEITPAALKSFVDSRGVVVWFEGDNNSFHNIVYIPLGYIFIFDGVEPMDADYLTTYISTGGRFFLTSQDFTGEASGTAFARALAQNILGFSPVRNDTDFTNNVGLKTGTLSESMTDVNIAGGDGHQNAVLTGEVDPNGAGAATVLTWDPNSGPGTITSSGSSVVQNRLAAGGGRAVFATFPFESIDHVGNLIGDNSGRENFMKQIMDWLRGVAKATGPDPADKALGVSLAKTLSWNRVAEAAHYRLYVDPNPSQLGVGAGVIIDRDNPRYTKPGGFLQNTKYYWRVDCKNVDDYTIGDVWTFNTIAPATAAANPDPAAGETQVPLDQVLTWTADPMVTEYDITIWQNLDDGNGYQLYQSAVGLTTASFTPDPTHNPNPFGLSPVRGLNPGYVDAGKASGHRDVVYKWRVDARNELGTTQGPDWTFRTITPPAAPQDPDPADNAINVATNKVVSWGVTTRTDRYHVFIWRNDGTAPTNTSDAANFNAWSGVVTTTSGLPRAQFSPGELDTPSVKYKWQVRPENQAGRQNTVTTWTFDTATTVSDPMQVANPVPADGAFGVTSTQVLSWDKAAGAKSYDVTVWKSTDTEPATPNSVAQTGTSYTPVAPLAPLTLGTTYNWRVNARNSLGTTIAGPLWTFTVGAQQVTGMVPVDKAPTVLPSVTLTWNVSQGAATYNVYLVPGAAIPVGTPVTATVTTNSYKPPVDLATFTAYAWRVDAVTAPNPLTQATETSVGPVQTFTTTSTTGLPLAVTGMVPANAATNVSQTITLRWQPAKGATSYELFLGTTLPTTATATLTTNQYRPAAALTLNTAYTWRVDSINSFGRTAGPTQTFTVTATAGGGGSGGGGGGNCFIATAGYESAADLHGLSGILEVNCTGAYLLTPERWQQLNDIRQLRDRVLVQFPAGRSFTAWYYAVGPYGATAIRDSEPAKAAVRALLLNPLSELSRECTDAGK